MSALILAARCARVASVGWAKAQRAVPTLHRYGSFSSPRGLRFAQPTLQGTEERTGSGTPTDGSPTSAPYGRGSVPIRSTLACRRSTAALIHGLSPVARGSRPGFLGLGRSAVPLAPPSGGRSDAVCAGVTRPTCPSPVVAPDRALVVASCMMPGTARERTVSFRARAPHSLRTIESTLAMASLTRARFGG